jgi:L-ribulose-5-phosphate 4-epimerase
MSYDELRSEVCQANKDVVSAGLVLLTWGNVSGVDRDAGVLAIKPSGVAYESLTPEDIVIVSLETGETLAGELRPSSDTPSHRALYLNFLHIGAIVHTHSTYATSFAQAHQEIPCLGTTHADHFYGNIPVTRELTGAEIRDAYEWNTGRVIVERFSDSSLNPDDIPAVLVAGHAPFAWGKDIHGAVQNAIVLEEAARMTAITQQLNARAKVIPKALLDKHYLRKHGGDAYYGQTREPEER